MAVRAWAYALDSAIRAKINFLCTRKVSSARTVERNEKFDIAKESLSHFATPEDVISLAQRKDPDLTLDVAEIEEIPGFFETATEITITERTFKKVIHKRQKYRVKNKLTKKETIVTAPGPLKLLPGCRYSVDFALRLCASYCR